MRSFKWILAVTVLEIMVARTAISQTLSPMQEACFDDNLYNIGYTALSRVNDDFILATTARLSEDQVVKKILKSMKKYGQPQKISSKESLAKEIYLAARAWKIDPFMLAALIENESDYGTNLYSGSGASGYTQMTGMGLNELRDQYSKGRLKETLHTGARKYFQSLSASDFISWISNKRIGNSNKKRRLRNHDTYAAPYGIALGASLLRIYLSVNKILAPYNNYPYRPHSYALALALYNGDDNLIKIDKETKRPYFFKYSRDVRSGAAKVEKMSQQDYCAEVDQIALEAFEDTLQTVSDFCEIIEDRESCEENMDEMFEPEGLEV